MLVWPELFAGGREGRQFVFGVIALQVACLGWAGGTAYTKRKTVTSNPLSAAAMQMLLSGAMLLVIATAGGEWSRLSFTTRSATAMLYLVLVGSIVGYSCFVYALKYLPVSTVSLYAYVNPIIAVVLGTLFLSEPFSLRIVAASALVVGGIAIVRSAPRLRGSARAAAVGQEGGGQVGRVRAGASGEMLSPALPPYLPYALPPLNNTRPRRRCQVVNSLSPPVSSRIARRTWLMRESSSSTADRMNASIVFGSTGDPCSREP